MAINQWVNVTMSTVAPLQPDRADHRHTTKQGTADGNDFTVAWDSAKCTTMTLFDSLLRAARQVAQSQLPP